MLNARRDYLLGHSDHKFTWGPHFATDSHYTGVPKWLLEWGPRRNDPPGIHNQIRWKGSLFWNEIPAYVLCSLFSPCSLSTWGCTAQRQAERRGLSNAGWQGKGRGYEELHMREITYVPHSRSSGPQRYYRSVAWPEHNTTPHLLLVKKMTDRYDQFPRVSSATWPRLIILENIAGNVRGGWDRRGH